MLKPHVVWLTGLSGSGKSTIAKSTKKIIGEKYSVQVIDGDNVRNTINEDLGFTPEDIIQNNNTIIDFCKKEKDAEILLVSVISPFRSVREKARNLFGEFFMEVFIKCSIEICKSRDVKGLYKQLEKNQIRNFVGVHIPYESPINPDIVLNTQEETIEESVSKLVTYLEQEIKI